MMTDLLKSIINGVAGAIAFIMTLVLVSLGVDLKEIDLKVGHQGEKIEYNSEIFSTSEGINFIEDCYKENNDLLLICEDNKQRGFLANF